MILKPPLLRTALAGALLALTPSIQAGWVDDWLAQNVASGPGLYDAQTRGYLTAGNFSLRYPMRNEPVVAVQRPRIRSGCGGIDVFGGGITFMDPDYLVDKFQRIIQAAPALAFDMALSTMSEKLGVSMKSLEQLANEINGMVADECQAANRLVEVATNVVQQGSIDAQLGQIRQGTADALSGITRHFFETKTETTTRDGQKRPGTDRELTAQCPVPVKRLLDNGSVLAVATASLGIPDQTDILRGLVGDIEVRFDATPGVEQYVAKAIPPCPENNPGDWEGFVRGTVKARTLDNNGAWTCVDDSTTRLDQQVLDTIVAISDKRETNQPFTPEEVAFIDSAPLPVLTIIEIAQQTRLQTGLYPLVSDVIAQGLGFQVLSDIYQRANVLTTEIDETLKSSHNVEVCNIKQLKDIGTYSTALRKRIFDFLALARTAYAGRAQEVNTITALIERFERVQDVTNEAFLARAQQEDDES